MNLQNTVTEVFQSRYGEAPARLVRAPGRVNLIGEHTDYNDGFVFPMAIDRATWIALRPRDDRRVSVHLLDYDTHAEFDLDAFEKGATAPVEYVKGMAWALSEAGYTLHGWEGVLKGDVPIGAGLSSSAAMEMAVARAFALVSGFAWNAPEMARIGQRCENQWIGVNSGIMDQMISAAGVAGHALLIDCRSLQTQPAPLPPGTRVVILDTGTRRGLVGSAYNERREQCEAAARFFGVPALRDVTLQQFRARESELDELTRKRARHVITEDVRTLQAREAMQSGDADTLGAIMNAGHISLRDDFEVSTDALNTMVDCAQAHPACYGARMTGGGFGGAAVALVEASSALQFAEQTAVCYQDRTGLTPQVYICEATSGASVIVPA